jgi:uncharacterized protein (TIGR03086 family)
MSTSNNTSSTSNTSSTGGIAIVDDPRAILARAIATAAPVVAGVRPHQLHLPTPCADFDVEQLLGHLLFTLDRVVSIGRGETLGLRDEVVTSDDWAADLTARFAAVEAAWSDDARLAADVELPWATMSGGDALGVYTNEVTVHTWDLARATGQQVEFDSAVVASAMAAIERELPMADRSPIWESFLAEAPAGIDFAPPFADATPLPADASPIDRLVAWNGRRP